MLKMGKRNRTEREMAASVQRAFASIGYKRCGHGLLSHKPKPFIACFYALKDGAVISGFRGTEVSLSYDTGRAWNYRDAVAYLPIADDSEITCGCAPCR